MLICQVVNLYELHFCDTQLLQRSPWVLVGFGNDVSDEFDIRKAGYISLIIRNTMEYNLSLIFFQIQTAPCKAPF